MQSQVPLPRLSGLFRIGCLWGPDSVDHGAPLYGFFWRQTRRMASPSICEKDQQELHLALREWFAQGAGARLCHAERELLARIIYFFRPPRHHTKNTHSRRSASRDDTTGRNPRSTLSPPVRARKAARRRRAAATIPLLLKLAKWPVLRSSGRVHNRCATLV